MMSDVKDSFAIYLNEAFAVAAENVSHLHRTDLRSAPCAGVGGSEENERENFLTSSAASSSSLTGKGSLWNKNSPPLHQHQNLASTAASSGILQQQQHFGIPVSATVSAAVYVNPKQYKRIVIRRQNRLRLERLLSALKVSKRATPPYLHESRHAHAMKRQRGPGGRFMPVIGGGRGGSGGEREVSLDSKSNENAVDSKGNENAVDSKGNENDLDSKGNENDLDSKGNENALDSHSSSSSSNSANDQVFALVHIK